MTKPILTKGIPITKQMVYEAYKKVHRNKGAAGIDKESLEDFDRNLAKNTSLNFIIHYLTITQYCCNFNYLIDIGLNINLLKKLIMHIKTSNQPELKLGIGDYTCNWGVHICGMYETEKERDEIIVGFLGEGDLNGDLQMYCPVEQTPEEFKEKYYKAFPQCNCHADMPEHFSISSAKELYYPNGVFSPAEMDKGLNRFFVESQKKGQRNVRATAEMVWALEAIPGVEHLMVYESRLNYFIPGKPWISICLYNVNKFSGATIMNVLKTHPYAISGGVITQNPYYMHPDKWLAENAPQFLNN